jgi:hypothetical protein
MNTLSFCDDDEIEHCEPMLVDDSFNHAFGTEIIKYWCCAKCGKTLDAPDNTDYEKN